MNTTLLDSMIEPFTECLTRDAAQKIANLRADENVQQRVDELASLANLGQLSDAERFEYDRYLAAFHFITIIQSKARRLLGS
ncbi:MAG: hypothetical protein R3C09_11265 [Pirellulaceae bacterium]